MKTVFNSLLLILSLIILSFSSCNNDLQEDTYIRLEVLLDEEDINDTGYYYIDLDNDSLTLPEKVIFKAHLYNRNNIEQESSFIFECDNLKFDSIKNNEACISTNKLKTIGVHNFKVYSGNTRNVSSSFVIESGSSLVKFNVKYKINSDFENLGYSLTEQMLSGIITDYNYSLNLASGCVYTLALEKVSENEKWTLVNDINVISSNSNVAYVRNISRSSFELVCVGKDKTSCLITVSIDKTTLTRTFKITLSDCSSSYIEEVVESEIINETIISLSSMDKEKKYKINVLTPHTDDTLLFSIDAELIDQNKYFDGSVKNYQPFINPNATWYESSSLTFDSWSEGDTSQTSFIKKDLKWSVSFNGIEKEFSIIPKNDTVFYYNSTKQENLHTYLYVKFKDDETYRWKYRIMVGGVIEGIQLTDGQLNISDKVEGTQIKDKSIIVDKVKVWVLKANYIPLTTVYNETWLYISSINEWTECYDDKGKFIKKIPKTIQVDDPKQGVFSSVNSGIMNFEKKWTGYYTSEKEKIYLYNTSCCPQNDSIARQSFPLTWGSLNYSVRFVAINLDTLCYDYVDFYSNNTDTATLLNVVQGHRDITNKSYYQMETPKKDIIVSSSVNKSSESSTKNISTTPYINIESPVYKQYYPYTISDEFKSNRKFYTHVNSTSYFNLQANYPIKSIDVQLSSVALKYLTLPRISIDQISNNTADIVIDTKYRAELLLSKQDEIENLASRVNDYLTDSNGVFLDLIITNIQNQKKYAKIQIVVYK